MSEEKKSVQNSSCLSGTGVTKIFGMGKEKTVAVDHVDFQFRKVRLYRS